MKKYLLVPAVAALIVGAFVALAAPVQFVDAETRADALLADAGDRKGRRDGRRDNRDDRQDGRDDNRDDRRDCRQEEGLVGDDKRECKREDGPDVDDDAEKQSG